MKKILFLVSLQFFSCCLYARTTPVPAGAKNEPMLFIENVGQINDQNHKSRTDIDFKLKQDNFTVFLGAGGIHYQWSKAEGIDPQNLRNSAGFKVQHYRMDVALLGANPNAKAVAERQATYAERYYLEHLGLKGKQARSFERVTYKEVYPGIDWVLYVSKDQMGKAQLKYDFVVHPGADPGKIKLQYKGADAVKLHKDGSLSAATPMGTITEAAPYAYIKPANNGEKAQAVASAYALNDNVLSFKTAAYTGTLVIDPALEWGTYYGGAGFDLGTVLACDFAGNVFLTGASWLSTNIATTGSHQSVNAGDFDAFLAKFDAAGNRLWATYYGGSSLDYGFGLTCDNANKVFISGTTQSLGGIATAGAHQTTYAGSTDNFLARFDTAGVLLWGTYYGSSSDEYNGICTTDDFGHVYLAGYTSGANNIAGNGHQSTNGGGNDAYLVQFDTSGTRLWGTYYGGSGHDEADGIACDPQGNIYLGGNTNSPNNIATSGSHQASIGGLYDNFLVKFDPNGARQWATYYGGSGNEFNGYMRTVACDKAGNVYTCGQSESTSGIATAGSHQDVTGGDYDAYLVKFNGMGQRDWATYYGGTGSENGGAIAIDFSGNIFWSGITASTAGIATADGHQVSFGGGSNDAFLARFRSTGVQEYGTYYGGAGTDEGYAVGFDYVGNAYISGGTNSPANIATPGAFSTVFAGGIAVYLAKFCTSVAATNIGGPDTVCANSEATFFATPLAGATAYLWDIPAGWSGSSNTASITVQTNGNSGIVSVRVVRCDTSALQSLPVFVAPEVTAQIVVNNMALSTLNAHSTYQWLKDGVAIAGATNQTYTVSQDGLFTVVVTNEYDCRDTAVGVLYTNGVGIDDPAKIAASIKVFPNPATDRVYLQSTADFRLRLLGVDGRVHLESLKTESIAVGFLSPGVYLLEFRDAAGRLLGMKKLVKQ
ncbi:MAG: hypothetical protein EOP54_09870 [Sphingobacteriales bacterium]|nr:MAG: hypothetical protein EOP54_09870 [Sphingobacteriales bacterium]